MSRQDFLKNNKDLKIWINTLRPNTENHETYEISKIEQDGNCLFSALSRGIYPDNENSKKLRQDTVTNILKNQSFFEAKYKGTDFRKTYTEMLKDGDWGDDVVIEAAAIIYQKNIKVYISFEKEPIQIYNHGGNEKDIKLFYNIVHYDLIKITETNEEPNETVPVDTALDSNTPEKMPTDSVIYINIYII